MRFLLLVLVMAFLSTAAGCGQDPGLVADGAPSRALRPSASGTLVPGGVKELGRTLAAVHGTPVVVNVWASWCEPCRSEFPSLQRVATRYAGRVVFIGVNAGDDRSDAAAFLAAHPTSYAHISDPDGKAATAIGASRSMPTTVFYGADGERRHSAEGAYPTEARLVADVDAYAIGG